METEAPAPVKARLLNGARLLGKLWAQAGPKCAWGWEPCPHSPRPRFCEAKIQWIRLAQSAGKELHTDRTLIESMSIEEFDASGLTIVVTIPGLQAIVCSRGAGGAGCETIDTPDRNVRVGAKGVTSMKEFARLAGDPAGAESVFKILDAFPGAKVINEGGGAKR